MEYHHDKVNKPKIILQVFDVPWKEIQSQLPLYVSFGYTHIQISPVQKHCIHTRPW